MKNIRSSSPDGEIDVGVGEDYNLDCVSSSGDIGNDIKQETDDTIQVLVALTLVEQVSSCL